MTRILLLFLLLPVTAFSQHFIGKNKPWVKKYLQRQIKKNDSLHITLTDHDSMLVYSIKAGKVLPAEFVYGFSTSGICRSEKVIANCDSCFKKFLDIALAEKKFEWKKINENQYVSKYSARRMIELSPDNQAFYYTILRTNWNRELYALLTGH